MIERADHPYRITQCAFRFWNGFLAAQGFHLIPPQKTQADHFGIRMCMTDRIHVHHHNKQQLIALAYRFDIALQGLLLFRNSYRRTDKRCFGQRTSHTPGLFFQTVFTERRRLRDKYGMHHQQNQCNHATNKQSNSGTKFQRRRQSEHQRYSFQRDKPDGSLK